MHSFRSIKTLPILLPVLLTVSCTVGPDFEAPSAPKDTDSATAPMQATLRNSGDEGLKQSFDATVGISRTWWTVFKSEDLNALIRRALENSPTLSQAKARLVQAQEAVAAQYGTTYYPAIDAQLGASRQQIDPAAYGMPDVPTPGPFNLFNASVTVSYTLDFFGTNRRELEALRAQVDYRQFELEAAKLTLAANLVTAAIQQASLNAQLNDLYFLIDAQKEKSAIMETRYAAGAISERELNEQAKTLARTQAMLPPLQKQREQINYLIAVYLGSTPGQTDIPSFDLNRLCLPEKLPERLSSEIARQRPDIRAAEALWHQACANVGVATANLYPNLTLSGSMGTQRTNTGNILNNMNVWSIGANLMQPIFHGGQLQAQKRSAVAAYDEAEANYRQTVLLGLQEVANVLQAIESDTQSLRAYSNATDQSVKNVHIAELQFAAGGISRIELLDAHCDSLSQDLERIIAVAATYANTAALLQALGGGWWNTEENKDTE